MAVMDFSSRSVQVPPPLKSVTVAYSTVRFLVGPEPIAAYPTAQGQSDKPGCQYLVYSHND